MRSTSHVPITPDRVATEATNTLPTSSGAQRRVMRAAWALHRSTGNPFVDTLRQAWGHAKRQANQKSDASTQGPHIQGAMCLSIAEELIDAFPVVDYRLHFGKNRHVIVELVDLLLEALDQIDGDPDFEPSLCFSGTHEDGKLSLLPSSPTGDDREDDCADNEYDARDLKKLRLDELYAQNIS